MKEDFRLKFANFILLLLLDLVPGTVGTVMAASGGLDWRTLALPATVTLIVGVTLSIITVSYTHLDVYKRQTINLVGGFVITDRMLKMFKAK